MFVISRPQTKVRVPNEKMRSHGAGSFWNCWDLGMLPFLSNAARLRASAQPLFSRLAAAGRAVGGGVVVLALGLAGATHR